MLRLNLPCHIRATHLALFTVLIALFALSTSTQSASAQPWPTAYPWQPAPAATTTPSWTPNDPAPAPPAPPAADPPAQPPAQQPPAQQGGGGVIVAEKNGPGDMTLIEITNQTLSGNLKNFGINVGKHDQFGASQIMKNVIPNPGFESAEIALVFNTSWSANGQRVQADNWSLTWNDRNANVGHEVGYWNGASFEVATGPAAGRTGTIDKFTHEDNKMTFYFDTNGTAPEKDDVIYLRHTKGGFFQKRPTQYAFAEVGDVPPGSPGAQSLKLLPAPNYSSSFQVALDSLSRDGDGTANKLFLANGGWRIEFWAKGSQANDQLQVEFRRIGENKFWTETFNLYPGWQKITRTFYVADSLDRQRANPGPIVLDFRIPPGQSPDGVFIDDASLQRSSYSNPTMFSDRYVQKLQQLKPGILRDWGDQLGSTLDNQLAPPFARKTTGSSPDQRIPADFHYSLHEFLELANHVNAEPWYVIPPTFSPQETLDLIAYLAAPVGTNPYAQKRADLGRFAPWTDAFPVIHLEYGNEMWGGNDGNDQFIGSSVRGGERLAQVSSHRMGIMRSSSYFNDSKFNLIVGGQYNALERQPEIQSNSIYHDTIALGPYYADKFDRFATDEEMYMPLFAEPRFDTTIGNTRKNATNIHNYRRGTQIAIYEVNMHTTFGNAPTYTRNQFVTSLGSGIALPLNMLTMQRDVNIVNQAAFTSLQYSHRMSEGQFVKLWGLLKDVEAGGVERPTWMGLKLANTAIRGNAVQTVQSGRNPSWVQAPMNGIYQQVEVPYIQSFAFHEWPNSYGLVLFNLNLYRTEQVKLDLVGEPPSGTPATFYTLTGSDVNANNENGQQVYIREQNGSIWDYYDLYLPPHSMTVITWEQ